jgi:hypothetical protein
LTPLLWAAELEHVAVVKLLVKTGKVNRSLLSAAMGLHDALAELLGGREAVVELLGGYEAAVQLLANTGMVNVRTHRVVRW